MNALRRIAAWPFMSALLTGAHLRRPLLPVLILFAAIFGVSEVKSFGQTINMNWSVSEFQPAIKQGGRANTIAVHPTNNDIIFVASESGGLFKSTDKGVTWRHVDSLPCFLTYSVAFVTSNPNILLVTTDDDFKTVGGGGVWRSTDGGLTWNQATVTLPARITGRLEGYEISIAPDSGAIYVGVVFGALMSSDNGASWAFQDVFGGGDRQVRSILALGNDLVLAGGPRGIRRSTDGGQSWTQPVTAVGALNDLHAFGSSPHSNRHAYVVNDSTQLFYTHDGGNNWTQIPSAPGGGAACGGVGFIKVVPHIIFTIPNVQRGLALYFSNRCGAVRSFVPLRSAGPDYSSLTWQNLNVDHGDTRDLAFNSQKEPLLLGTDGGLHKTNDYGVNWSYIGGGRDGYNALQITEVKGQYFRDTGRHDLYFATQDNDVWASGDTGLTWPGRACCEGFFIEAERAVETASNPKIAAHVCGACNNKIFDPLLTNGASWSNPPGNVVGAPIIFHDSAYLQGVDDSGGFSRGLAATNTYGASWRQFASFPEDRRDPPKVARLSGRAGIPGIIYQAYKTSGSAAGVNEINYLMRITGFPSTVGPTRIFYPAMNNFGGLGIKPTMFAYYPVFAINPGNPYHLMASDVINQRVMETHDGGDNWTEVPGLTNLVTDNGRLLFSKANERLFSNLTAISFSTQLPRGLLAGTDEGAIYHSSDLGAHWSRIPGSEKVTAVTSFHWRTFNDVIVSTYGRGLWRLRNVPVFPRRDFDLWCWGECATRLLQPGSWERAILTYNGRVMGARVEAGVVQEVFVTPDSSVLFGAEAKQLTPAIQVTETNTESGFSGVTSLPKPPQPGWIIKGLVFDKDNRLGGVVFGDKPMELAPPESDKDLEGPTKSPVEGKPYLRIVAKRFYGAPTAEPGEVIRITGTNFPRDSNLELTIDGQPSGQVIKVDGQGLFSAQIPAPRKMGLHSLVIHTGGGKKTALDSSALLVTHVDEFKKDN